MGPAESGGFGQLICWDFMCSLSCPSGGIRCSAILTREYYCGGLLLEESMEIFKWVLNSPSAVMMALGNELRPGFYYYDEFLARLKEADPQLLYTDIAGWSAYTERVDFSGSVPTYGEDFLHRVDPSTDWITATMCRRPPSRSWRTRSVSFRSIRIMKKILRNIMRSIRC